jgi:hypothetical protein
MKKGYRISLLIIGILAIISITIGTSYSVWLDNQEESDYDTKTLECFKVYFSDGESYNMTNIKSVINEEGKKNSPNSIAVTNICDETKELQIRLNILEDNTIDTKALTIDASGHIEQDSVLYNNLENKRTSIEGVTASKLVGLITVEPNETVRTNIKLWFDERKAPIIDSEKIFSAKFELIDTASSIKSTFAETLLKNVSEIENKTSPDFNTIATTEEGLYLLNENGNKTYYYRGTSYSNYVFFANQMWRIVSINNNQVKLISEKSVAFANYSSYANAIDYTGLKYIYNNQTINNDINNHLGIWYQNNIINTGLDQYTEDMTVCNDTYNTVSGYHTYFNAYNRLVTQKIPTLTCAATNADFGGAYTQKVGLITADEVVLAGGMFNADNTSYYLNNGETFFTMTPLEYFNYASYVAAVTTTGSIAGAYPNTQFGIRPVILLNSSVTVSGEGTIGNPYTIDPME